MAKTIANVQDFMESLEHPMKDVVESIRGLILEVDPAITEHIKWNAPSFCINGEDRVTMNLRAPTNVQLIFHRGAKPKDTSSFFLEDSSGLLKWQAPDRAIATFTSLREVGERRNELESLIFRWMTETS